MTHKLQLFPPKNNGSDSVVLDTDSTSNTEITNDDAGLGPHVPVETQHAASPVARPGPPANADSLARPTETQRAASLHTLSRCEAARSAGYDPTGEHAVACGALAQVVCEYCGPLCSTCADETFCYYGEHKLGPLPTNEARPAKMRRPVREVVYIEINCPNCRCVRLALPKKHRPKAIRKCPICKTKAPAQYLAHGITRRRLPYHEVFSEEKELPAGIEFKRRLPWDHRPAWWVEED